MPSGAPDHAEDLPGPSKPPRTARVPASTSRGTNIVMASHGRSPWYDPDGKNVDAYVIGIAGGSASGKTSVARAILSALNFIPTVLILSQDAFYNRHTQEELDLAFKSDLDLDHPDAIDIPLFEKCLHSLRQGKATEIPVYSFVHHQRMPKTKHLYGASVIIVEGIMALQSPEMRKLYDLKVFVNCDSDLMLARRLKRDIKERGRDVDGVIDQYLRFVKDSYDNFVLPSARHADIIVPGSSNHLAIELLVTHVKRQLDSRSLRFRKLLANMGEQEALGQAGSGGPADLASDESLILLEQTNQLRGIMTILRDRDTERGDFIFHADRLSTLIVEKALSLIPYQPKTVTTPLSLQFEGVEVKEKNLIGVSILRSGGPFVHGLRRVIRDVPVGAMLIQSDPKTGEPLLLRVDLPQSVKSAETSKDTRVLLLDSQMGTGAAAMMAIKVLLDHGVPQSNIIFLTFLISRRGRYAVRHAFPSVRIVTAAIDEGLEEMHLPLTSVVMGEAAGEADFAVRYVDESENGGTQDQVESGEDRKAGLEGLSTDGKGAGDGFKMPERRTEELKFSRKKKDDEGGRGKRAWVVLPGMGHIGDRYYTS